MSSSRESKVLLNAAKTGDLMVFRNTCISNLALLGDLDEKFGRSSLHWAAQGGHCPVLLYILFSPSCSTLVSSLRNVQDIDGRTALAIAAKNSHVQAVQCLLAAGVDIGVRDKDGLSALDLAQNSTIVTLLSHRDPLCASTDGSWVLISGKVDHNSRYCLPLRVSIY